MKNQTQLIYHFESNKSEDMTYLTICVDNYDKDSWIIEVEHYKYIPLHKIAKRKHEYVELMLNSYNSVVDVNPKFISLMLN